MIFSVIILLIALVIAYLHYIQGAFTSAISLGCAFMATLIAFGYYENIVNMIGAGKFGDVVGGLVLIGLYALSYTVLRVIFDSAIPGNLTLPLYVERVGAGVFGLLAGMLASGVIAIGAQLLPFGPSIGGYAKYEVKDRVTIVPQAASGKRNATDSNIFDEMSSDTLNPSAASNLLVPVDNMVLSFVSLSSDGGYAGNQSFSDVHPDLTTEAFGARLGIDHSGNRVLFNTAKSKGVSITGLFTPGANVIALDAELTPLRPGQQAVSYKPSASNALLVVRASFEDSATDKDGFMRATPAAVRLHVDGIDYRPIGTMDGPVKIALNRVDDQIIIPMQGSTRGADFVFDLPKTTVEDFAKSGTANKNAFVEIKLFGRVNLAGIPVAPYTGPGTTVAVVRKPSAPIGTGKTPSP